MASLYGEASGLPKRPSMSLAALQDVGVVLAPACCHVVPSYIMAQTHNDTTGTQTRYRPPDGQVHTQAQTDARRQAHRHINQGTKVTAAYDMKQLYLFTYVR